MSLPTRPSPFSTIGVLFGAVLVGLLVLPLIALALSSTQADLIEGISHPLFMPSLTLSLWTTTLSLGIIVLFGTPLAWWLANTSSRAAHITAIFVELPIIIPPAVLGVALLQTFGRYGLLGPILEQLEITIPFTVIAVILTQIVVASPFFVQAGTNAFRKVDSDTLLVARTLGASRAAAFFQIALPAALPGLIAGASLAWARALGEFGATLLFAGNLTGKTQTMPLAIFSALESDVRIAVVFSLVLGGVGALLLIGIRLIGSIRRDSWRAS